MKRNKTFFLAVICISGYLIFSCNSDISPQGGRIYEHSCAPCHGADGTGVASLYPSLLQSTIIETHTDSLACMIKYGSEYKQNPDNTTPMPPQKELTEAELTNVINYIYYNIKGNKTFSTNINQVRESLKKCE